MSKAYFKKRQTSVIIYTTGMLSRSKMQTGITSFTGASRFHNHLNYT